MNIYVKNMKTALDSFADTVRKENEFIKQARAVYKPDVADAEAAKMRERIGEAARQAREKITAARDAGREAVNLWGRLDGAKIDTADLALLNGSFRITGAEIDRLVEKHKDNATMLNAISKYYDRHRNERSDNTPELYMSGPEIPTVETKTRALNNFARRAEGLVNTIQSDPGRVTSYSDKEGLSDASSVDMLVAGFGDPGLSERDSAALDD